ncbi:MAG TPA: SRPBCC domain-containing protein [Rhodopila sp.]|nr:SRPBCC domain-containing protein [Rhodopila sp.]
MTSLTIVRRIAARPSVVFDAISTPEGLTAWMGPDAGPVLLAETDLRLGGPYRVRFRMLDGSEHECTGVYVEIDKPRRLAMTWRWTQGGDDLGESRLSFELRAIPEGTELTLTHAELQTDAAAESHTWGWNGALDKLERHFNPRTEGGANANA